MDRADSTKRVQTIRETVDAFPQATVVYLFGSVASGQAGPLSDVDVAVWIDRREPRRHEVLGRLQDALCRRLHTDRVDLVELNDAPAALAYRVIRDGRRIRCTDEKARQAFESRTVMRYLDFQPLRACALRRAASADPQEARW